MYGTKLVLEFSRSMRRPSEMPTGTHSTSEPVADHGADADGERAVERETLARGDDARAERAAERARAPRALVEVAAVHRESYTPNPNPYSPSMRPAADTRIGEQAPISIFSNAR